MFAGGYPGDGCCREVSRGVGDAAPYGLPGNGRQREPAPHPALRGHLPPRGKARAVVGGRASLRGASGTPPPTVCPGMDGDGRSRRGGGTPPYGWGYGNTIGLTRAVVSGPPRGRGRACPARGVAWADVCGWLPGGWPLAGGFAGRRGRRPLRVARERAAAEACPSSGPAGPPSPEGEGKGCCWRQREPAHYPGSWSSVRSWRVRL